MTDLAQGMQPILELRRAGKRPALPVMVWLTRQTERFGNPSVRANVGRRYDWRALIGLDVLVQTEQGIPAQDLLADLMRARQVFDDGSEVHLVDVSREAGFRVRYHQSDLTVEEFEARGARAIRYEVRLWPWSTLERWEHFRGNH